jgi:hypothetical protein
MYAIMATDVNPSVILAVKTDSNIQLLGNIARRFNTSNTKSSPTRHFPIAFTMTILYSFLVSPSELNAEPII